MATATTDTNITPEAPLSRPKVLAPVNPLALLWGGVMLIIYAWWIGKIETQPAIAGVAGGPPQQLAVTAPPMWLISVLFLLGLAGIVLGVWQALTWLQCVRGTKVLDQATLDRDRQRLGNILIVAGVVLAVLGAYLVSLLRLAGFAESVGLCLFALVPLLGGLTLQAGPAGLDLPNWALRNFVLLRNVLYVLGGAGIIAFIYLVGKKAGDFWLPEIGGLVFESLLCLTAAVWLTTAQPHERTPFAMRCFLLILGGVTGLIMALQAFCRTLAWRDDIILPGIVGWTGVRGWELWLCLYLGLAGLMLMFGSLLLARAEVRNYAWLRLAMYGYSTLVSGLLLLQFLAAVNVLVAAIFPMTMEWTRSGFSSLSDSSKSVLANLKTSPPVTIYVLISQQNPMFTDIRNLLNNCQAIAPSDKLKVVYVKPESDRTLYLELATRFPEMQPNLEADEGGARLGARGRGILIVQGPLPEDRKTKVPHAFISDRKIVTEKVVGQRNVERSFRGEIELMKELGFLLRGQQKRKIYMLQGDNELTLNSQFNKLRDDVHEPLSNYGAFVLADKLTKDNYEVVGLNFGSPSAKPKQFKETFPTVFVQEDKDKHRDVPADAWALVVLGPGKEIPKETLDALDRYMDGGNGKMLVALDLVLQDKNEGTVLRRTGMEEFLRKYGVAAEPEQFVLRVPRGGGDIRDIFALPPNDTTNTLAKQFVRLPVEFSFCHVVRPADTPGRFKADVFLQTDPDDGWFWIDSNVKGLSVGATDTYLARLVKDPQFARRISPDPIPVAVAVSEESKADFHKKEEANSRPRLVAFGSSDWLSNSPMLKDRFNYSVFISSLEWMGDRPVLGTKAKESTNFALPRSTNLWRMVMTPLWFMCMAIVYFGVGIWLVRRR